MISKTSLKQLKQTEVAALLGLTERRIQQLHAEGLPRNGSGPTGTYDWHAVLTWRDSRISGSKPGEAPTDKEREQKAKADMAEMEAAKMGGELVDAQDVVRTWQAFLGRLRQNLLGLADRVGPRLDDGMVMAERIDIIRREVYQSLRDVVAELGVPE